VLSNAKYVSAHAQLEVLGRLVQAGEQNLVHANTTKLAAALTDPEQDPGMQAAAAKELVERLKTPPDPTRLEDRLGRRVIGQNPPDDLVSKTRLDLQSTVMTVLPKCRETTTYMEGIPALNIVTDVRTSMSLAEFYGIVNPFDWPQCWLESRFFKGMDLIPAGVRLGPIPPPDQEGWQATLLETVDFSFGFGAPQEAKTELDFVFFFNRPSATRQFGVAGSTYDFKKSRDGKISVDQGFLLVEELGQNVCRYRTQKLVHMNTPSPPDDDVCAFWSVAVGLIQQGCATTPPTQPGPP
jgi:hypothetical protein